MPSKRKGRFPRTSRKPELTDKEAIEEFEMDENPIAVLSDFFEDFGPEEDYSIEKCIKTQDRDQFFEIFGALSAMSALTVVRRRFPAVFRRLDIQLDEWAAQINEGRTRSRYSFDQNIQSKIKRAILIGTREQAAINLALSDDEQTRLPWNFSYYSMYGGEKFGSFADQFKSLFQTLDDAEEVARRLGQEQGWSQEKIEQQTIRIAADWILTASRFVEDISSSNPREALAFAHLSKADQTLVLKMGALPFRDLESKNLDRFIDISREHTLIEKREKIKELQDELIVERHRMELGLTHYENAVEQWEQMDAYERTHWKQKIHLIEIDGTSVTPEPGEEERWETSGKFEDYLADRDLLPEKTYLEALEKIDKKIKQLNEQLVEIDQKIANSDLVLYKALYLSHKFAQEEDAWDFLEVDWVSDVPFDLINWAYKAYVRGIEQEEIETYVKAKMIFPEQEITEQQLKVARQYNHENFKDILQIQEINRKHGISISTELLLQIDVATFETSVYADALDRGYQPEHLFAHPWILRGIMEKPLFPAEKSKKAQHKWLAIHAEYKPLGWNDQRVGQIMLTRLQHGTDWSTHDASYWFKEFEAPKEFQEEILYDHKLEWELIRTLAFNPPEELITFAQQSEKKQRKIRTKWKNYEKLFSKYETLLVFRTIYHAIIQGKAPVKKNSLNVEVFREEREKMVRDYQEVDSELTTLLPGLDRVEEEKPISYYIGRLRRIAGRRQDYHNDAQKWIITHASTPTELLVKAWKNREVAIAEGVADNPHAIATWAEINALRLAWVRLESNGDIPENISKADLDRYANWLGEILKSASGSEAINALSQLKESYDPRADIPPMRIDLGNGWVGEVLKKNDPRGFSLGVNTGCCMTLDGMASEDIWAGYEEPQCGFFALSRNGNLVAQSFLYTNSSYPEVLVADNIEANEGRDKQQVLAYYQEFFDRYFTQQMRRNKTEFRALHIGREYTDISLPIQEAEVIPIPFDVYSDAQAKQYLGFQLPQEVAKEQLDIQGSILTSEMRSSAIDEISTMEEAVFEGAAYTTAYLKELMEKPDTIVALLKKGDRVIGYTIAVPENVETLTILRTAIDPEFQGQRLVGDLMYYLDIEAKQRGFTQYERSVPPEFGDIIKRNYSILAVSQEIATPWGSRITMRTEVPEHQVEGALFETDPREKEQEQFILQQVQDAYDLHFAAEVERKVFGEDFVTDVCLDFADEWTPETDYSSILFYGSTPIGYIVAERGIKEDNIDTLYVYDLAIDPAFSDVGQFQGAVMKMVIKAVDAGHLPIEMTARSASYKELLKMQDTLRQQLGYEIVEDTPLEEPWEGSRERAHQIRLDKTRPGFYRGRF